MSFNAIDTEYVWSNGNLVAEKEQNGTTAIYNYGIDGIATRKKAGNTEYYVKNIHGDVTALTDSTGTITKNYQFDAFGNELAENDNDTNPFRYCGEYYDTETGLIYLRNRYYDTATGRFISEDPVKDGLNWYVYCANNPVMFMDPWGLFGDNSVLRLGTYNNSDVILLQKRLNELGHVGKDGKALEVDGNFGPNTEYAVKEYQRVNGLEDDGSVGPITWKSLGIDESSRGNIYGNYYSTNLVFSSQMKDKGYVEGKDYIVLFPSELVATSPEAAEVLKQIENENLINMTSMCVSSINISGFTKHGLAQIMGRDEGRGVSNEALLDAVNNPIKVVNQSEGKIKYIGKNATIVVNKFKEVITGWARNSNGLR